MISIVPYLFFTCCLSIRPDFLLPCACSVRCIITAAEEKCWQGFHNFPPAVIIEGCRNLDFRGLSLFPIFSAQIPSDYKRYNIFSCQNIYLCNKGTRSRYFILSVHDNGKGDKLYRNLPTNGRGQPVKPMTNERPNQMWNLRTNESFMARLDKRKRK